jgi:hypothetical protein
MKDSKYQSENSEAEKNEGEYHTDKPSRKSYQKDNKE